MSRIYTKRQSGIVAIMVTMIMMIVISLIILGFVEISLGEKTDSLNNQLSVQAFYASESGINDARAALSNDLTHGRALTTVNCLNSTTTDPHYPGVGGSYATLNSSADVEYTCVLINPNPRQLVYDVGYTSTVIPLISSSAFGSLQLTWTASSGAPSFVRGFSCNTPIGSFPPTSQWNCPYPVLRVDLVPANGLSRVSLLSDTSTTFFKPELSSGSPSGSTVAASCNSQDCTATISRLTGTHYYMRVTTIYSANSVLTITSSRDTTFSGAQATIDSTGKAQDVLRRIIVAVDLTDANAYAIPSGALVTEYSVCKQFQVTPGYFSSSSTSDSSNPLCNYQTGTTPEPSF